MGTRGECVIRWNEHQQVLQGTCIDLLASERFADVTLFCEGMGLKCHKFILSACSPYFERVLSEAICGDRHPVIILKDVTFLEMQALLQFVYQGELTIDEAKLGNLIKLAQSLHIKGIGEFREEPSQRNPKKKPKVEPVDTQAEKTGSSLREYPFRTSPESIESNINSLTDRMLNFPPENQHLIAESLSAPLDTSDYNLQETEVEYTFQSESLEVGQTGCQQILVEYTQEANTGAHQNEKEQHTIDSEAEMSSDASFQASVTPVYKQYTEQNLLAAIKAVLCEGMKQAEASVKFCIPFTTLTRKIRLYQACGGRLPTKRREKPRVHDMHVMPMLSAGNDLDGSTSSDNHTHLMDTDARLPSLLVRDRLELATTTSAAAPTTVNFQSYKQYSEASLKQAISAVLDSGMRATDAATHFGIPLTTLTRKVRSHKESVRCQGPPATARSSFCVQKS